MTHLVIASIDDTDFSVELTDGRHVWLSDEPGLRGGGDTGPTPHDLLLSSLGACTSITLRMYAKHKGWEIGAIQVTLSMNRTDGQSTIDRQIVVSGQLSAEQRHRLLEVANNCPVHNTLCGSIVIKSQLT